MPKKISAASKRVLEKARPYEQSANLEPNGGLEGGQVAAAIVALALRGPCLVHLEGGVALDVLREREGGCCGWRGAGRVRKDAQGSPPLPAASHGTAWQRTWLVHTSWATVQSTCAMFTWGSALATSVDSSSHVGASFLQWPHQGA